MFMHEGNKQFGKVRVLLFRLGIKSAYKRYRFWDPSFNNGMGMEYEV